MDGSKQQAVTEEEANTISDIQEQVVMPEQFEPTFTLISAALPPTMCTTEFQSTRNSFEEALHAVLKIAVLPAALIQQAIKGMMYFQARELHKGTQDNPSEELIEKITSILDSRLRGSGSSSGELTLFMLSELKSSKEFGPKSFQEVLRQATVATWSAFEVLAGDLVAPVLNQKPVLVKELLAIKTFASIKSLPIDTLVEHGFDLSTSIGDWLIAQPQYRIDGLYTIKELWTALASGASGVIDKINRPELRQLYLRRNLITHRRCRIDKQYVTQRIDNFRVGEMLQINSSDLLMYLRVVAEAGGAILKQANLLCNRS